MKRVLIIGSTGNVGKIATKEFKNRGYWVRCLTRNPDKLKDIEGYIDDVYVGEVTKPNSIKDVCNGIDIVFSSLGITTQKDRLSYMDVDYQGNKNVLDLSLTKGIEQFIYVSVLNQDRFRNFKTTKAKERFVKSLESSGLKYTIVKPTAFFSEFETYLRMAQRGRVHIFGSGDRQINPIHVEDLVDMAVDGAQNDIREIKIGGPEVLTHREIIELAFKAINKKVKISRYPVWLRGIFLIFLRIFMKENTFGPLEYISGIMTENMVGCRYGKFNLEDYFEEKVGMKEAKTENYFRY